MTISIDRNIMLEEILKYDEKCGRQVVFRVPNVYNKELAQKLLNNFIYVLINNFVVFT